MSIEKFDIISDGIFTGQVRRIQKNWIMVKVAKIRALKPVDRSRDIRIILKHSK